MKENAKGEFNTDYWKECLSISAEECGLELTDEQLDFLADGVKGGFENYGMAHGHDMIRVESEDSIELKRIKKQQEEHRIYLLKTKPCHSCNDGTAKDGWGRDCTCNNCNGTGRV